MTKIAQTITTDYQCFISLANPIRFNSINFLFKKKKKKTKFTYLRVFILT